MTIGRLPAYPSTHARRQLPPSQLASLNKTIASTLAQSLSLPPEKRDLESCRIFVQTYARNASLQALHTLIWGPQDDNKSDQRMICQYTLKLAEIISSSLDLQALLDLAIGYSQIKGQKSRLKAVFTAISEPGMPMHDAIVKDLVPSFTLLLSPQSTSNHSQGLYAIRKTAHCVLSFLRASPATFIRHFAHSKDFILSLAYAYETSLASIATSYGGINVLRNAINRSSDIEADEWEKVWVDTKVALIDSFHIVLGQLLEDMTIARGPTLALEAERTFDIVFSLLERSNLTTSSSTTNPTSLIPFLDQSLLADYQQSYSLSQTLASVLKNAEEKDARLDIIESTLAAFDSQNNQGKNPGVLKIVLYSYGLQRGIVDPLRRSISAGTAASTNDTPLPSIDNATSYDKGKGKAKAPARIEDPELDVKVTQILDVLPDLNPVYVRLLLGYEMYEGDPEQVLSALLEGRAPTEEEINVKLEQQEFYGHVPTPLRAYDIAERRNVFDNQELDLAHLTIGKKNLEFVMIFRKLT
jgi:activating signal cointegrator complex subunit 2